MGPRAFVTPEGSLELKDGPPKKEERSVWLTGSKNSLWIVIFASLNVYKQKSQNHSLKETENDN